MACSSLPIGQHGDLPLTDEAPTIPVGLTYRFTCIADEPFFDDHVRLSLAKVGHFSIGKHITGC